MSVIGQIPRGSVLGEKIYNLVTQPDVNTVLDLGTWNGGGSVACIKDGILDSKKKDYSVFSFEVNEARWKEAQENLAPIPSNFFLIHGTIVDAEELYQFREIIKDKNELKYLEEDISHTIGCENFFKILPPKLDLVIIDGGGASGKLEFEKLRDKTKYFVLDDTTTIKNEENRKFILSHPEMFEVLFDDLVIKGQMIAKNLKF
jgi:hypothetical protein